MGGPNVSIRRFRHRIAAPGFWRARDLGSAGPGFADPVAGLSGVSGSAECPDLQHRSHQRRSRVRQAVSGPRGWLRSGTYFTIFELNYSDDDEVWGAYADGSEHG